LKVSIAIVTCILPMLPVVKKLFLRESCEYKKEKQRTRFHQTVQRTLEVNVRLYNILIFIYIYIEI
jgi:hypothetical protein